jgi:hypothetical protein
MELSRIQRVADKLVDAALEYVRRKPNTRIDKIYFLAYTEHTRDILEHKFSHDDRAEE